MKPIIDYLVHTLCAAVALRSVCPKMRGSALELQSLKVNIVQASRSVYQVRIRLGRSYYGLTAAFLSLLCFWKTYHSKQAFARDTENASDSPFTSFTAHRRALE